MDNPKKSEIEQIQAPSGNNLVKEEIDLQLHYWLPVFFIIYFVSFLLPAVLFTLYIMLLYLPYFLEIRDFSALFSNPHSLICAFMMPVIIIVCYLIHLFFVALITRGFWSFAEKRSPSKSGIIPRNIPSKTLNYYHFRSFIIKYPKNAFSRGPFPWLLKWMYNFTGSNKIGKESFLEEQVAGDRFIEIGENSYLGTNIGVTSHAVEGIFGNISIAKIKIGNNFTAAGFDIIGPGVETGDNSWWLPMTGTTKYNVMKGNSFYFGTPLRKIFKKKLMEYLQITAEDLKKHEDLNKKLINLKNTEKQSEEE